MSLSNKERFTATEGKADDDLVSSSYSSDESPWWIFLECKY